MDRTDYLKRVGFGGCVSWGREEYLFLWDSKIRGERGQEVAPFIYEVS